MGGPLGAIVELMAELVPAAVRASLVADPAAQIPLRFRPARTYALAELPAGHDECSCDGYYETDVLPGVPLLLYRDDASPRRVRFTLLHELGHHLVRHVAPDLLDLLDEAAGRHGSPGALEERACHLFAGRLLVPDGMLADEVGAGPPTPDHVAALYRRSGASWEATAVRVAGAMRGAGAVVLVREAGRIAFAASSPTLGSWWPRRSTTAPAGPLARALTRPATAAYDAFRAGLPHEQLLWCDVRLSYAGLAVAVMADRPSDGRLNVLPEPDAEWGTLYCERCGELREGEWCSDCRSARCEHCEACGCYRRPTERRCEGPCGLLQGPGAYRPGSDVCRDCLGE